EIADSFLSPPKSPITALIPVIPLFNRLTISFIAEEAYSGSLLKPLLKLDTTSSIQLFQPLRKALLKSERLSSIASKRLSSARSAELSSRSTGEANPFQVPFHSRLNVRPKFRKARVIWLVAWVKRPTKPAFLPLMALLAI